MSRLFSWLAGTLLVLALLAGSLLLITIERQPLVDRSGTISPLSVAQARWLLQTNDPRRLHAGEARQTAIPAALIDEGVNFLATRFAHGRGALVLSESAAEFHLSWRLPTLASEYFVNMSASIQEAAGEPRIAAARIGALPIPASLVEFALASAINLAGYEREWHLARQAIVGLRFEAAQKHIIVSYVWEPALLDRARSLAMNPDDLARLRSAQEMLAAGLDHMAPGNPVALPIMLGPLLNINGSDQREQRRAAIFVLAAYLAEKNIASLIPEAASWPQPRPVMMTLFGRYDSAQHFAISAALAAWAGEPVADAIGLYKEMVDARHGSGFSFADLAADRAGTRFGQLINRGDTRLDALLQSSLSERDLMPSQDGLPEHLSEREFRRQFGNPASAAYQRLNDEIERRLDSMPLYKK